MLELVAVFEFTHVLQGGKGQQEDHSSNAAISKIWAFLAYLLETRREAVCLSAPFSQQLLIVLCDQLSQLAGGTYSSLQSLEAEYKCSLLSSVRFIAKRWVEFMTALSAKLYPHIAAVM